MRPNWEDYGQMSNEALEQFWGFIVFDGRSNGSNGFFQFIGKDGGEKLRRGDEVNIAEIFSVIDSMPMRQRETRKDGREKTS